MTACWDFRAKVIATFACFSAVATVSIVPEQEFEFTKHGCLSRQVLVEELENLLLRIPRLWGTDRGASDIVTVRLPFVDVELGFNFGLPQRAVHPYGVAEQQVPGARDQNLRRETLQITIDR